LVLAARVGGAANSWGQQGLARKDRVDDSQSCLSCHAGIEPMHPEAKLDCVGCHGGDGTATSQSAAHVSAPSVRIEDERVAPRDKDLAWIRFRNPMDLRVVERTCGQCHASALAHLMNSLHGTTAGHLSDGYYEMGLFPERGSRYSVFPQTRAAGMVGEVTSLVQLPAFQEHLSLDKLSTHYTDLARKECLQCHLWSEGRALRGGRLTATAEQLRRVPREYCRRACPRAPIARRAHRAGHPRRSAETSAHDPDPQRARLRRRLDGPSFRGSPLPNSRGPRSWRTGQQMNRVFT
jgi:hypothetical protein